MQGAIDKCSGGLFRCEVVTRHQVRSPDHEFSDFARSQHRAAFVDHAKRHAIQHAPDRPPAQNLTVRGKFDISQGDQRCSLGQPIAGYNPGRGIQHTFQARQHRCRDRRTSGHDEADRFECAYSWPKLVEDFLQHRGYCGQETAPGLLNCLDAFPGIETWQKDEGRPDSRHGVDALVQAECIVKRQCAQDHVILGQAQPSGRPVIIGGKIACRQHYAFRLPGGCAGVEKHDNIVCLNRFRDTVRRCAGAAKRQRAIARRVLRTVGQNHFTQAWRFIPQMYRETFTQVTGKDDELQLAALYRVRNLGRTIVDVDR